MIGYRSGLLTVVAFSRTLKNDDKILSHRTFWLCKCDCGNPNLIEVRQCSIASKHTKSCGCLHYKSLWKGYQDISGAYWSQLKGSAKMRGIPFLIKIEDVWEIYQEQNGFCALSNRPIIFIKKYNTESHLQTASVDRIDSNGQYSKENCQILHKDVNFLKSNIPEQEFIDWCVDIADFYRNNEYIKKFKKDGLILNS